MKLEIDYGEAPRDHYDYDRRIDVFERSKEFESNLLMGKESLEEKILISINSIRKTREKWRIIFI